MNLTSVLDDLRTLLPDVAARARVPYSSQPQAAVLLLEDGTWVPGVRVESASFSLVIPPLLNAVTTAVAAGRTDVVAAVVNDSRSRTDDAFLEALPSGPFAAHAADACVAERAQTLPSLGTRLVPFLDTPPPATPLSGVELARKVAEGAHVPLSNFPVGCIARLDDGRLIPGVNVEHTDWTRVLCAERSALGTAVTYGTNAIRALYLSCMEEPRCTPCGACRQLLLELAPECVLWMDRGKHPPERAVPSELLPGGFTGEGLVASSPPAP